MEAAHGKVRKKKWTATGSLKKEAGFSIMEIMVVGGLLVVIQLGILNFFKQANKTDGQQALSNGRNLLFIKLQRQVSSLSASHLMNEVKNANSGSLLQSCLQAGACQAACATTEHFVRIPDPLDHSKILLGDAANPAIYDANGNICATPASCGLFEVRASARVACDPTAMPSFMRVRFEIKPTALAQKKMGKTPFDTDPVRSVYVNLKVD